MLQSIKRAANGHEEAIDLDLAHLGGMAFSMKVNEPSDPDQVGLFPSAAVVSCSQGVAHAQQELLLMRRRGADFAGVSGH